MKRFLALIVTTLAAACGDQRHSPSLPADRPPTMGEVRAARLATTLAYDPAAVPEPFWATWRGEAVLAFEGPVLGLDHLPGTVETVSGFEELDGGCLSGVLESAWSVGAGTIDVHTLVESADEATLTLTGTLAVVGYYGPVDPRNGSPEVLTRIEGYGTWTVSPGAGCGPDDFRGGLTGTWAAVQIVDEALVAEAPAGPRARLLILDGEGHLTTVDGPTPSIVRIAGELR